LYVLSKELGVDIDTIKDTWSLKKIISWGYALRIINKEIENTAHNTGTSDKKHLYIFK